MQQQRPNQILVAVNGSAADANAVSESVRLAHWSKGGVTGITVTPSYDGDLSIVGVKDMDGLHTGSAVRVLRKAVNAAETLGMRIGVRCEAGDPAAEIAGFTADGTFGLLVLGAERRPAIARTLLGNPRPAIIRAATNMEVLIVPEEGSLAWDNVLLVFDASDADATVLSRAAGLAQAYDGRLKLFKLGGKAGMPLPEDHRQDIATGKAGDVLRHIQERGINLVILTRRLGMRRGLIRNSLADRIIDQNLPVLVLKSSYVDTAAPLRTESEGSSAEAN